MKRVAVSKHVHQVKIEIRTTADEDVSDSEQLDTNAALFKRAYPITITFDGNQPIVEAIHGIFANHMIDIKLSDLLDEKALIDGDNMIDLTKEEVPTYQLHSAGRFIEGHPRTIATTVHASSIDAIRGPLAAAFGWARENNAEFNMPQSVMITNLQQAIGSAAQTR